jgi:hypothetical protein
MLNSVLGLFILTEYPTLNENHPDIYRYVLYFSAKWLLAFLGTFGVLLLLQTVMKLCCCAKGVCHNTIGAFPVLFLIVIILSYFYSLYYGVVILREMYLPENQEEEQNYQFKDPLELLLLRFFVYNEVIVGAILIL